MISTSGINESVEAVENHPRRSNRTHVRLNWVNVNDEIKPKFSPLHPDMDITWLTTALEEGKIKPVSLPHYDFQKYEVSHGEKWITVSPGDIISGGPNEHLFVHHLYSA